LRRHFSLVLANPNHRERYSSGHGWGAARPTSWPRRIGREMRPYQGL